MICVTMYIDDFYHYYIQSQLVIGTPVQTPIQIRIPDVASFS